MMRKEKDALGEVLVPRDSYYGAQTARAVDNFAVGTQRFGPEMIRAHGLVKSAAARVNCRRGRLDARLAGAIEQAAEEVIAGRLDGHFPLVVWQSGSGTQFNMNVNEVIANRAIEILGGRIGSKDPVHPNDHVNLSQSTNDTVPTSIHIAAATALRQRLLPAIQEMQSHLQEQAKSFDKIIKIGRTHLQDATPLRLGQEFSGYAAQLQLAQESLQNALEHLYELPIGATAVGTGLNAPAGFDRDMVEEIRRLTDLPFRPARNKFAGLASHEAIVETSGALKTLAAALLKIANDIRWLASGPRCGIGELTLPANEPGSSIMPGKVNPTQCEMLSMVVCQVFGNDCAVTLAAASGNFELNAYKPLLAHALLGSITLLADAIGSFDRKCLVGIEPNLSRIERHLHNSLMLVTALSRHIGYDKAAEIALAAYRQDKTLRQSALELGYVTGEQFDQWVRPEDMLAPEP
ncbi:MAG: class II fumarate hydratase [Sedimentisphaerales bacterium]|nr:class II fumarate hydratase [Sedimentisphaerales bacterium]